MATFNLSIDCKSAEISGGYNNQITVEINDADMKDVMNSVSIDDFIEHFGIGEVLSSIGQDEAIKYWDIK